MQSFTLTDRGPGGPATAPKPGQPGYGQPGYGQQGYGQPGQPGQEDLPPPPPELMDRTYGQQQAQPGMCILKQPNTNVSIFQTIQR